MVHATVRYSFIGPDQKGVRGRIRKRLEAAGFTHVSEASWEAADLDLADAVAALKDVLDHVATGRPRTVSIWLGEPGQVSPG